MATLTPLPGKMIAYWKSIPVAIMYWAITTSPIQRTLEQAGFFRDGKGVVINTLTALSTYRAVP